MSHSPFPLLEEAEQICLRLRSLEGAPIRGEDRLSLEAAIRRLACQGQLKALRAEAAETVVLLQRLPPLGPP